MKKRFLSILLTAVLLLCAVPLGLGLVDTAYAAETANSGTCGDNVTWRLSDDGVLTISGTGAMQDYESYGSATAPWYIGRSRIKSVVIESGVTGIGDYAFYDCSALTSVTIPGSVTSIGEYAFSRCEALTSMTIPGSVTSIGNFAFSSCDALTSVTIPDGVTSIGTDAFSSCDALTSVTISVSVTKIGAYAFSSCEALTDIYYGGYGVDWLAAIGFNSVPSKTTVHFKEDLYDKGTCGVNANLGHDR